MLPLDRQIVNRVAVPGLLVLRLHLFIVLTTFLLGELLAQDRLMSFIFLLLRVDIVELTFAARLLKECLICVLGGEGRLLCLLNLPLSPFSQLISQWNSHVLPPQLELGLQLVVVGHLGEERVVSVWGKTDFLQLTIHSEHDLLALSARHVVKVQVLHQDRLVLALEESFGCHVNESFAKALLCLLLGVLMTVMVLLDCIR